jgi:solute carrier family 35 protein E1
MPHSTSDDSEITPSSANRASGLKFEHSMRTSMEKFPDHVDSFNEQPSEIHTIPIRPLNGYVPPLTGDRWPRRESRSSRYAGTEAGRASSVVRTHGRQKSISEAIRTIRTRRASVSANAHEIADALKAPVSPRLIVCYTHLHCSSSSTDPPRFFVLSGMALRL